ncbi:hypothetical protein EVAR_2606_1 [Eumeta japonica]|uniref:Uncharacterized protein n=1 Tax=Eumeta variegata TaxID=151549 RepID=A0A4C1SPN8_EUMVA|nr:hypothetical protein EVAR_2606_1 [Eumeta japonica]
MRKLQMILTCPIFVQKRVTHPVANWARPREPLSLAGVYCTLERDKSYKRYKGSIIIGTNSKTDSANVYSAPSKPLSHRSGAASEGKLNKYLLVRQKGAPRLMVVRPRGPH